MFRDKDTSRLITLRIHSKFSGIGCFEGIFKLQVRKGSCPYQAPPRRLAYALQEPLKEELNRLHKQQIIVPLGVDEMSEW